MLQASALASKPKLALMMISVHARNWTSGQECPRHSPIKSAAAG
jgi:hypothetical protein